MIDLLSSRDTADWTRHQGFSIGEWGEIREPNVPLEGLFKMVVPPKLANELWAFCCAESMKLISTNHIFVKFDNSNYFSAFDSKVLLNFLDLKNQDDSFDFPPERALLFNIGSDINDISKLTTLMFFILTLEGHATIILNNNKNYLRIADGYIYERQN